MLNYALLDGLITTNQTFLLYKEPLSVNLELAVFSASSIECVYHTHDLDGKSGYVFAPFEPNESHPIVLLNDATLYQGEEAINRYVEHRINLPVTSSASTCSVSGSVSRETYETAFNACHNAVIEGECQKIVLSRKLETARPRRFSPGRLFAAACETYTEAYVYLFHSPITGTWLGSTPEALLTGDGASWQTVALAGTQAFKPDSEIRWDAKNRLEQQIVSDYVEQTLGSWGIQAEKQGPHSIRAAQLVHLNTTFQFNLPASLEGKMGSLIDKLHPTPATCGFPKEKAMRMIRQVEAHDRSYYCGFIGSLSEHGSTRLFVNLRCMCIQPTALVLFAGGGIMAESTCESEWEETESKLQTLLSLLD